MKKFVFIWHSLPQFSFVWLLPFMCGRKFIRRGLSQEYIEQVFTPLGPYRSATFPFQSCSKDSLEMCVTLLQGYCLGYLISKVIIYKCTKRTFFVVFHRFTLFFHLCIWFVVHYSSNPLKWDFIKRLCTVNILPVVCHFWSFVELEFSIVTN